MFHTAAGAPGGTPGNVGRDSGDPAKCGVSSRRCQHRGTPGQHPSGPCVEVWGSAARTLPAQGPPEGRVSPQNGVSNPGGALSGQCPRPRSAQARSLHPGTRKSRAAPPGACGGDCHLARAEVTPACRTRRKYLLGEYTSGHAPARPPAEGPPACRGPGPRPPPAARCPAEGRDPKPTARFGARFGPGHESLRPTCSPFSRLGRGRGDRSVGPAPHGHPVGPAGPPGGLRVPADTRTHLPAAAVSGLSGRLRGQLRPGPDSGAS